MSWKYKTKILTTVPEGALGFIYRIDFSNGDYYIGRKNFYSERRVKVIGRKNRKKVVKESNWKVYNTSSTIVKERIASKEAHTKTILHLCASKACIQYWEVHEQVINCVLCDPKALNGNILMRLFHCTEPMKD